MVGGAVQRLNRVKSGVVGVYGDRRRKRLGGILVLVRR